MIGNNNSKAADFLSLIYQRIALEDYEEDDELINLVHIIVKSQLKLDQTMSIQQKRLFSDYTRWEESYHSLSQEAYFKIGLQYGLALAQLQQQSTFTLEQKQAISLIINTLNEQEPQ